jgi:hypothetical protein
MVQVHFKGIEHAISSILASAKNRIYVAVAWFTNDVLFSELKNALQRNVEVKVIILDDILNRNEFGLDYGILANNGAYIRFASSQKGIMHNKFSIIDNKVVTGSYNWTYHANINNENIVVIDEPDILKTYVEQFVVLFNDSEPIKLPYEHIKWTDIKEGDFSELRRNIFRDIIAKKDVNCDLKRIKLINLNDAYKSGNSEEIARASSLSIEQPLRTITDVLTSRSQDFMFKLWEENIIGNPVDNVDGYEELSKWFYIPYNLKEDEAHREYINGAFKTEDSKNLRGVKGLNLKIYDEGFVATIKKVLCGQPLSLITSKLIPDSVLCIDHAKMFFYQFPSLMFNKSQPKTWDNIKPRTISAINIFAIAKNADGDNVTFYDGWDPQKRGEKIAKEFFVKPEELVSASSLPKEQEFRTITEVLTSTKKKYKGELYYPLEWDLDVQPADVRYSTIGKWIFIPKHFGETIYHEKYIRGYLHYYPWYKKRRFGPYKKIEIDIYDDVFVSTLSKYIKDNMDSSSIPEKLICIDHAKLSIYKYHAESDIKVTQNVIKPIAVFCLVKEINDDAVVYYEGWDPETRGEKILKKVFR